MEVGNISEDVTDANFLVRRRGSLPFPVSGDRVSTRLPKSQSTSTVEQDSECLRWRQEAMRLSQRVMELELENARLRQQLPQTKKSHISFKSASNAVALAAAASRRSRERRKENVDIPISLSCSNLENLESAVLDSSYNSRSSPKEGIIPGPTQESSNARILNDPINSVNSRVEGSSDHKNRSHNVNKAKNEGSTPTEMGQDNTSNHAEYEFGESFLMEPRTGGDIRAWVGSWNMGAVDPFTDSNGIIDEQDSSVLLQSLIPHGFDLYVIGVQEGLSGNVYHAIEAFLNRNTDGIRYLRLRLENSKFMVANRMHPSDFVFDSVKGRGDGAFMGTKFTGIAIFHSIKIQDNLKLIRAATHKFSFASGSKGGVAAAIRIKGATMVFVNCHLDARHDSNRRDQIRLLNAHLGRNMGSSNFDLTEQFHHVIWMGDLNYRIHSLDPETVLHMLSRGRNIELHDKFDGLLSDRKHGVFQGFVEPNKWPTFFPTYKKYEHRGAIDITDASWPSKVYRIHYKEPFYKGGQIKSRVPGWCDRILVHSMNRCDSTFSAEKVPHPFMHSVFIDNYRSVNDGVGMDISDHSPVTCTFILKFPDETSMSQAIVEDSIQSNSSADNSHAVPTAITNRPVCTVIRVSNVMILWDGHQTVPKKIRVVAPLIGEDDGKQSDVLGEREMASHGATISANLVIQHHRPLKELHMLLWIRHETVVGHTVIALRKIESSKQNDGLCFRLLLMSNSCPVYHEGSPVKVSFCVRASEFLK